MPHHTQNSPSIARECYSQPLKALRRRHFRRNCGKAKSAGLAEGMVIKSWPSFLLFRYEPKLN